METAQAILDAGANTLLAVKANQSGRMGEMARFVDDPSQQGVAADTPTDKGHGRIKERKASVSTRIDRLAGERHVRGEHRCHGLAMIAKGGSRTWKQDNETRAMDSYVSFRAIPPNTRAEAVQSYWAIDNSLHWALDVGFGKDRARSRTGHEPAKIVTVRHVAFNILKAAHHKRSLTLRRSKDARNPEHRPLIIGLAR